MDFPCKLNYHYMVEENIIKFVINQQIKVYIIDKSKIKFEVVKRNNTWDSDIKKFQNLITFLIR